MYDIINPRSQKLKNDEKMYYLNPSTNNYRYSYNAMKLINIIDITLTVDRAICFSSDPSMKA